jgi:hypothetical protein
MSEILIWKDVTSYSRGERDKVEPKAWECRVGTVRLCIHRYIGYSEDQWLGSCHDLGLKNLELCSRGASAQQAQNRLVELISTWVAKLHAAFEALK